MGKEKKSSSCNSSAQASYTSEEIIDRCRRIEGKGLRTFVSDNSTSGDDSLVLERAEGAWLYNPEGKKILDLSGLYAVATIGHTHPCVVEAICRQANDLIHCPSAFPSRVRVEFLEAMRSILPSELDAVFPAITGAMANELAISIAKYLKPNAPVVSFSGSYFGRSMGVVGLAGKVKYREPLNVPPSAQFIPYPSQVWMGERATDIAMDSLECLTHDGGGLGKPAAVMLEPVQGNGGVVIPPSDFLPRIRDYCDKTGALMIVDEIQSGCGRTGKMWAIHHSDVVPDIMTIGKAIGGGMAVSAVASRSEFIEWPPDSYSSTFLTNHVNLAAAVAAINVIKDEKLVERSKRLGEKALCILQEGLAGKEGINEIRGRGLWIAIEFVSTDQEQSGSISKRVSSELMEHDLLIGTGGYEGEVIKMAPPLNIDEKDLEDGLAKIIQVIRKIV